MTCTLVHVKDYIEKIWFGFHSLASIPQDHLLFHPTFLQNLILTMAHHNNDDVGLNVFLFQL